MDTQFEAKIVNALELISATANQAWWHNQSPHCGSDFHHLTCQPCFAFDQCKRNELLIALFHDLQSAVA